MIFHNKKYQTLIGCLFDRQLNNNQFPSEYTGLIITTDIIQSSVKDRWWMTVRIISTMKEIDFDFNTIDLELFLNLKLNNNSKYDSRDSFTYKYRYIQ